MSVYMKLGNSYSRFVNYSDGEDPQPTDSFIISEESGYDPETGEPVNTIVFNGVEYVLESFKIDGFTVTFKVGKQLT